MPVLLEGMASRRWMHLCPVVLAKLLYVWILFLRERLGGADVMQVEDEHNTLYLARVKIGTPPQVVNLNFDTGSADTWV
jgi:hypothetical protein